MGKGSRGKCQVNICVQCFRVKDSGLVVLQVKYSLHFLISVLCMVSMHYYMHLIHQQYAQVVIRKPFEIEFAGCMRCFRVRDSCLDVMQRCSALFPSSLQCCKALPRHTACHSSTKTTRKWSSAPFEIEIDRCMRCFRVRDSCLVVWQMPHALPLLTSVLQSTSMPHCMPLIHQINTQVVI